jgi:hypothetical protein
MNLTLAMTAVCAAAATAAVLAPAAERFAAAGLGAPSAADGETSATFALPPPSEKNWRLTLALCGSPSNRLECAFGRDADADAALGLEEIEFVCSWSGGLWELTGGDGLGECRGAAASAAATNALSLDIRFGRDGAPVSAAFRDGGGRSRSPASTARPRRGWTRADGTRSASRRGGSARAPRRSGSLCPRTGRNGS